MSLSALGGRALLAFTIRLSGCQRFECRQTCVCERSAVLAEAVRERGVRKEDVPAPNTPCTDGVPRAGAMVVIARTDQGQRMYGPLYLVRGGCGAGVAKRAQEDLQGVAGPALTWTEVGRLCRLAADTCVMGRRRVSFIGRPGARGDVCTVP